MDWERGARRAETVSRGVRSGERGAARAGRGPANTATARELDILI